MRRFVRWLRARAELLARRVPRRRARKPSPTSDTPAPDNLILAFAEICRALERPFAIAEIRAAAPAADGSLAIGGILLAAERLGFRARALKPRRHNLAGAPPPFLVAGRRPGEAWLATRRIRDHLVLVDPGTDRTAACSFETVADLAERIVLLKPLGESGPQAGWRDTMLARLRPVLWELGIASVVINLLALATPLFLMTVYNTDAPGLGLYRPAVLCLDFCGFLGFALTVYPGSYRRVPPSWVANRVAALGDQ